jgi:hypothetical protein
MRYSRIASTSHDGKSPYEVLHSRIHNDRHKENKECKPITNHLRKIRCVAYHRIPNEDFSNKTKLKLGERSKRCALLEYTDTTKIWRL